MRGDSTQSNTGARPLGTRDEPNWWHDAACINVAGRVDFFPGRGESAREAKAVCAECTVRAECLDYALRFHPLCGVWGGLSERERRRLQRAKKTGAVHRRP